MDRLFKLSKLEQALVQLILLAYTCVVLFPIGIAVLNSLKPNLGEVYKAPFGLPSVWSFNNYATAWVGANFQGFFVNSAIISLACVVIVTFCASTTAFVLVRMPFRGSTLLFAAFLLGVVIPIRLTLAPLFVIVKSLGLLDSLLGVILVQSASMMPVAVFILTSFLRAVPAELEDAARMDGALPFQIYWRVVLPLIRPALATVALLTFVQAWNEYFLPLIFLRTPANYPITLGMSQFRLQFDVQWHLMFAGILIMLIPTIVAFLLASRQFIEGLTQGGVKE
ncbi:sugar ABC transporter permease [Youhaiella tibetensis]|uniref:Carbohydrate ABC transporter permease n=1 Tax=Paradevosia tibetensis TaxID=1447062 RepID=A0A5B9DTI4_9HYPH|nr:carbohydrate ABC transporter permease [Youhaiella tibetensis]AKR56729.1 ABC transporter permease [Devosia sp. H5989]QEE21758.1 carbohydrate ABC transporter permease [Youhaiella tibetensis]GGF11887.1 sugar ABC transporter permease [Youhaiella tibetensis]